MLPRHSPVLLRIHFLYQHFTAPKWTAHITTYASAEDGSDSKACQRPPMSTWIVEKTVAYLLTFITTSTAPNWSSHTRSQYATAVECDLIQTMVDLAILAEYLEENTSAACSKDDSQSASDETLSPPIQIVLFPQTSALHFHSHPQQLPNDVGQPPLSEPIEYVLDIPPVREVVWSLQTATLNALNRLCFLTQEVGLQTLTLDRPDDVILPPRQLRSPLPNETLQDLLGSLRPILLSTCVSVLAERARSAALEFVLARGSLLLPPVHVAASEEGLDLSILLELALLVVHAIGGVLLRQQQWRHYAPSASPHVPTQSHDVLHNLTVLLRRTVLFPPRIRGCTPTEATVMIRRVVLTPLVEECLPWMQPLLSDTQGTLQTAHQRRRTMSDALEEMVLRTLHACLHATDLGSPQPNQLIATNSSFMVSAVGPLFELLMKDDGQKGHISMYIVATLLKTLSIQVGRVCSTVWFANSGTETFWSLRVPPPPPPYSHDMLSKAKPTGADSTSNSMPAKQEELKSPATTGATKSKRRASLLGSNPLTFRSPTANKRQRLLGKLDRDKAFSSWSSQNYPCFVEDILQQYLSQGLRAAQSIVEKARNAEGRGNVRSLSGDFWKDTRVFFGCMKLLQTLFAQGAPSFEPFAVCFAQCWLSLSGFIYQAAQSPQNDTWTSDWQDLAGRAIDCGLACFQQRTRPLAPPQALGPLLLDACERCCAAVAAVASRQGEEPAETRSTMECQGACVEIIEALAVNEPIPHSLFGSDVCLCDLAAATKVAGVSQGDNNDSIFGDFHRECDAFTVISLSLVTRLVRCCTSLNCRSIAFRDFLTRFPCSRHRQGAVC
jgi:hypothetical protein